MIRKKSGKLLEGSEIINHGLFFFLAFHAIFSPVKNYVYVLQIRSLSASSSLLTVVVASQKRREVAHLLCVSTLLASQKHSFLKIRYGHRPTAGLRIIFRALFRTCFPAVFVVESHVLAGPPQPQRIFRPPLSHFYFHHHHHHLPTQQKRCLGTIVSPGLLVQVRSLARSLARDARTHTPARTRTRSCSCQLA